MEDEEFINTRSRFLYAQYPSKELSISKISYKRYDGLSIEGLYLNFFGVYEITKLNNKQVNNDII